MKFVILVLYLILLFIFYIFVNKRLKMLNKRHMKHIESVCLKKNYKTVMSLVTVLFILLAICSGFVIVMIL
jgi:hypothetical protein